MRNVHDICFYRVDGRMQEVFTFFSVFRITTTQGYFRLPCDLDVVMCWLWHKEFSRYLYFRSLS